jgi:hypothetical protein
VRTHRGGEEYVLDLELMTQTHAASGREQRIRPPVSRFFLGRFFSSARTQTGRRALGRGAS